ncbi:hypothetical protein [Enterovirga aerilata]|uniref:Uncharacterized protein n=1 Tax=Enterovirga aerilata TaxID=2730920 RepID=A0A849I9M6_9HYPH|nr:hypothetical protein [Enterovirga sp. DB1703]NNM74534.1 hypothetical protein [Enterovirga sp. DB1703]
MSAALSADAVRPASRRVTDRWVLGGVSVLFCLPNLVLAAGLQPVPGAVLAAASVAAVALLLRAPSQSGPLDRQFRPTELAGCLALAVLILVLGGALHLVYANPDWLIRDAVLADLSRHGFPLGYDISGVSYHLRAPLGMYLVPALAGRLAGLSAAHAAMLAQNALLLGAIFYLLLGSARSPLQLAILVGFGGLGILWRPSQAMTLGDPSFIFFYARPLDEWNGMFQYSSSITQFFWVPNHALPGWWLGTLLILLARRQVDVATVGLTVATLVLWSPLAILPAAPALLWVAATRFREVVGSARTWIGAAVSCGFLPAAAYVAAAAGTIDHGSPVADGEFTGRYFIFIVLQLAPAIFVLLHRHRIEPALRGLFAGSVALLVVLPLFSFGPNNDLVMRASIPALLVIGFVFGAVLIDAIRDRASDAFVGIAVALLGTTPAIVEISRALIVPRFAISDCSLVEASRNLGDVGAPANYMARVEQMPGWLMAPPAKRLPPPREIQCWPDLRRPDRAL